MIRVADALKAFYLADERGTGLPAMLTNLYYDRAPENAVYPYGVQSFFGGAGLDTGTEILIDTGWQLLFVDGPHGDKRVIAEAMAKALKMFWGVYIEPASGWACFPVDRGKFQGATRYKTDDPESPIITMSDWDFILQPL